MSNQRCQWRLTCFRRLVPPRNKRVLAVAGPVGQNPPAAKPGATIHPVGQNPSGTVWAAIHQALSHTSHTPIGRNPPARKPTNTLSPGPPPSKTTSVPLPPPKRKPPLIDSAYRADVVARVTLSPLDSSPLASASNRDQTCHWNVPPAANSTRGARTSDVISRPVSITTELSTSS